MQPDATNGFEGSGLAAANSDRRQAAISIDQPRQGFTLAGSKSRTFRVTTEER